MRRMSSRTSAATPPGDPGPEEEEVCVVPARDRVRLDDHQRITPPGPEPAQQDPEHAIAYADARPLAPCLERGQLPLEHKVLRNQIATRTQGGLSLSKSWRCLAPTGRLFAFGAASFAPDGKLSHLSAIRGVLTFPLLHPLGLMNSNRGIHGVNIGHLWGEMRVLRQELEALIDLWKAETLRPVIDQVFPFDQAPAAHRRLMERKNVGKVLLVPG
jgi:hypothetical protein